MSFFSKLNRSHTCIHYWVMILTNHKCEGSFTVASRREKYQANSSLKSAISATLLILCSFSLQEFHTLEKSGMWKLSHSPSKMRVWVQPHKIVTSRRSNNKNVASFNIDSTLGIYNFLSFQFKDFNIYKSQAFYHKVGSCKMML